MQTGCAASGTNASDKASHSFSSSGVALAQRAADERWTIGSGMNIRSGARSSQRRSRRNLFVRKADRVELGSGAPHGGQAQYSQRVFEGMVSDRWPKPKVRSCYLYRRLRRAGTI